MMTWWLWWLMAYDWCLMTKMTMTMMSMLVYDDYDQWLMIDLCWWLWCLMTMVTMSDDYNDWSLVTWEQAALPFQCYPYSAWRVMTMSDDYDDYVWISLMTMMTMSDDYDDYVWWLWWLCLMTMSDDYDDYVWWPCLMTMSDDYIWWLWWLCLITMMTMSDHYDDSDHYDNYVWWVRWLYLMTMMWDMWSVASSHLDISCTQICDYVRWSAGLFIDPPLLMSKDMFTCSHRGIIQVDKMSGHVTPPPPLPPHPTLT